MSEIRPLAQPFGTGGLNLSDIALPPLPTGLAPLPGVVPLSRQHAETPRTTSQTSLPRIAATPEILAAHFVRKSYRKGSLAIPVLQGVDLSIGEGEFVAIVGPSGCGKSTLLHLLATLDAPDVGEICFEGNRIDNLPSAGRDILRNKYFGMVFQFYHLLPELTVLENVLMPAMIGQGIFGYLARRRSNRERPRK